MSVALLLPKGLNGTFEVGISAGVDVFTNTEYAVIMVQKNTEAKTPSKSERPASATYSLVTDVEATVLANKQPCTDRDAARLWNTGLALIAQHGWYLADGSSSLGMLTVTSEAVQHARTAEEVNNEGMFDTQQAINLLLATKITWYMTNHHVGQTQGTLSGYVGKVAQACGLMKDGRVHEQVRNVLWSLAKAMSTKAIIKALGIKGAELIQMESSDRAFADLELFTVADDARMRIESNPAGSARLLTYLAIIDAAKRSPYVVMVPHIQELDDARAKAEQVRAAPLEYHMGASWLHGGHFTRKECDVFSEDTKNNLSAFVHSAFAKTTLARANVIMHERDVHGHVVYQTIMRAKSRFITMGSSAVANALLEKMVPSAAGLALQLGVVTEEDVLEITEAADDDDGEDHEG